MSTSDPQVSVSASSASGEKFPSNIDVALTLDDGTTLNLKLVKNEKVDVSVPVIVDDETVSTTVDDLSQVTPKYVYLTTIV